MRLTRLYIPDTDLKPKADIALNPDQAHYMTRVIRLEPGQNVILFNERSGGWIGVFKPEGKKAHVIIEQQIQHPMPPRDVHLLAAPVKKEAWDFILEKATELGVAAIQPVFTDYTQTQRINDERAHANLVEASQQCERTHIPQFLAARKLDDLLAAWDVKRILYAALEGEDVPSLRQAAEKEDRATPAAILVGPEGGFSQREKDMLKAKSFVRPVSLGNLILRSDTAAVTALAVWQSVEGS